MMREIVRLSEGCEMLIFWLNVLYDYVPECVVSIFLDVSSIIIEREFGFVIFGLQIRMLI